MEEGGLSGSSAAAQARAVPGSCEDADGRDKEE